MLDWLKEIIGESYTEEIDGKVAVELGKQFVARNDFNTQGTALKQAKDDLADRDKQLEDLKKSSGDAEALKKQIETLQNDNKAQSEKHAGELTALRLENAVDRALAGAKARDARAVRPFLVEFLENAKVGEDGTVKGLTEEITRLAGDKSTAFLFGTEQAIKLAGMVPGESSKKDPPGGDAMTKEKFLGLGTEEQQKYIKDNPNWRTELK
ncbi:MAG: phage scaffolding protein [Clostridiales bacterium]|nr:phage scaffolding protein [Clostridiales bacterium]